MNIKSSIRDYQVQFETDFIKSIKTVYNPGDIIIVDSNVFTSALSDVGSYILLDVSEQTKEFSKIADILDLIYKVPETPFTKRNKLIAVGGGITQDAVGFISSIIFRGVDWVFYPTTLLAQGDSCIGGKTSINFNTYKNQLGNFYPPNKVIVCSSFLDTLPEADMLSGLGEMLHFFLVSSREDYLFFVLNKNSPKKLTARCLEIKRGFVELDEFDKKERLILNYGHTFGHAIESCTNNKVPHGVAVSLGMDIANYISYKRGYIDKADLTEIGSTLKAIYKDLSVPNTDQMINALKQDKKNISDKLNCVLTKRPGNMFLEEVNYIEIEQHLNEFKTL